MNNNIFSMIVSIVATVAVLTMAGYVIPAMRRWFGDEKVAEIKRLIELAVRYAEQVYTPEQWAEKKKAVQSYIYDRAKEAGLSDQDIDVLIEATVHEVKVW